MSVDIRDLWHRVWYRHKTFEKPGVGHIGMCCRRFSSEGTLVVRPETMERWQEPYRIPEIERGELYRILKAPDSRSLIMLIEEILQERKSVERWFDEQ